MFFVAGCVGTTDLPFLFLPQTQLIPFLILSSPFSLTSFVFPVFLSLTTIILSRKHFLVCFSSIFPFFLLHPASFSHLVPLFLPTILFCSCCMLNVFCLFSFFHFHLFSSSFFVYPVFMFSTPSLPSFCSLPLCSWVSGQCQGVFTYTFPPLSLSLFPLHLSTVLSFSCGSLGSPALRLYLCLWERRQPSASN